MLARALYTKHRRPTRLSDPHHDFTSSALAELLSISDDEMTWQHFSSLLGPHLSAGTYAETTYFFPRAVDYLLANHDAALDLITPIVGFASNYSREFEQDGLLSAAREALLVCLASLTAEFEVVHFNQAACAAKGWQLPYFDLVVNQEAVCLGTTDLVRFGEHIDLAEQFVESLAHPGANPTKAAWFLEYARSVNAAYMPPDHPPIQVLLSSRALLQEAGQLVRANFQPQERSPTYWRDTFAALSLSPDA